MLYLASFHRKSASRTLLNILGPLQSPVYGRRTTQLAKRTYSTESKFSIEVDYGDYNIVLPPENVPAGVTHGKINEVPLHIGRPRYAKSGEELSKDVSPSSRKRATNRLDLGSEQERRMRRACTLAKDTLNFAGTLVKEGATPEQIDSSVHQFITSHNAYPSPLKYQGFPNSICTSVNNIVAHGIPDKRPLENGDIMNVDVTVYLDGYHGDTSRTFAVGDVDNMGKHLLKVAQEALRAGINACGPGRPYRAIGDAIHSNIYGSSPSHLSNVSNTRPRCDDVIYSICTSFTGHGIGSEFHMRPWIIHTKNEEPEIMVPGDCFTIEPIILQTSSHDETSIWLWKDGWTASTDNGARGAVFEHTVLITENGVDILTG